MKGRRKKTITILLVVFMLVFTLMSTACLFSCFSFSIVPQPGTDPYVGTIPPPPVRTVESLLLSPSLSVIEVGKTARLTATVLPRNAVNRTVSWESSDPSIATVSDTGVVTGVREGAVVITASAGERYATAEVTVMRGVGVVAVTGVAVNPSVLEMTVGSTEIVIATVLPINAANRRVSWYVNNSIVSLGSTTGSTISLTANSLGSSIVTVRTEQRRFAAAIAVTVVDTSEIQVRDVVIGPTSSVIDEGQTRQFTRMIIPSVAIGRVIATNWSIPAIDAGIARVSSTGLVTALSEGETILTVQIITQDGNFTATATIIVRGKTPDLYGWTAISTAAEFNALLATPDTLATTGALEAHRTLMAGRFFLANDIDFGGAALAGTIGVWNVRTDNLLGSEPFTGVFDGRGFNLRNFTARVAGSAFTANNLRGWSTSVFQVISNATVRNLGIVDATIDSSIGEMGQYGRGNGRGGVFGQVHSSLIENISITHSTFAGTHTGGGSSNWAVNAIIAGSTNGTSIIRNVVANSSITNPGVNISAMVSGVPRFENIWIVNDGVVRNVNFGGGELLIIQSNINSFRLSMLGMQNFSALDERDWVLTTGQLPRLRRGIPPHFEITVGGLVTNDLFSLVGESSVPLGASYVFRLALDLGYADDTVSVPFSTVGTPGTRTLTGVASGRDFVFTIPAAQITGAIAIGEVAGVRLSSEVASPRHFNAIFTNAQTRAGNYYLAEDVDFQGQTSFWQGDWHMAAQSFSGTFDGRGFAIRNVLVSAPGMQTLISCYPRDSWKSRA